MQKLSRADFTQLDSPEAWLKPMLQLRIKGMVLGYPGKFEASTGPVELTADDFSTMSRDTFPPGTHRPRVHRGHPNTVFYREGDALGAFERLYWDGQYFRGDLANVSIWDAREMMDTGSLPERSMELSRKGDAFTFMGLGLLGASAPGIPGMPPVTPDMCEWMSEEEAPPVQLSADPNVIRLTGLSSQRPTEESMPEITQAQLDALTKRLDETDAKLAAQESEKVALAGKVQELEKDKQTLVTQLQQNTQALLIQAAQTQAVNLTRGLVDNFQITEAVVDPEQGNLAGVLAHIALSCPDMQGADGKPVKTSDALAGALGHLPSILPRATGFSPAPANERKTQPQSADQKLSAQVKAEMAKDPKLSYLEALTLIGNRPEVAG